MALLLGSIGGLGTMSYLLYQVWLNETEFSWFTLGGIRNEEDFVMTEDGPNYWVNQKPIKKLRQFEQISRYFEGIFRNMLKLRQVKLALDNN